MIDRVFIGWHRLVAGLLDAFGRLRTLPTVRRDARIDDVPVGMLIAMGGHDLSAPYWDRRSALAACGCIVYRSHVVAYAFDCQQHDSGFRDPDA